MGTTGESRARRVGRGTGLVLAGAVGATALTGIAFAKDNVDEPAPPAATAAEEAPSPGPGHWGERGWGVPGTGPVLHGQDTVRAPDGSFKEILTQNGTITAVSAASVTVASEDGYTATYSIDADTRIRVDRQTAEASALVVDRPVRVIADSNKVATLIGSTTAAGQDAIQERREGMREKFRDFLRDRGSDETDLTSST